MTRTLIHRGPDDEGLWTDPDTAVAIGHRRLSILDLSPAGHQPMASSCGRYIIAYNGEVYSHEEIRSDLVARGRTFRGHSDTEVIVEACAEWGLEAVLPRLIGMFAIALWDRHERVLWLARDRLGKKPLYWGHIDGLFLFGSELKALRAHPHWTPRLDRDALAAYMRHNYVPAPYTIYKGIRKLGAGNFLRMPLGGESTECSYWNLSAVIRAERSKQKGARAELLVEELDVLLRDAVKRRMVSDVPLGAMLSGGVDSSLVTALMQAQSARPVKTFSIGFNEPGFDEAPYAKEVASHLRTDHTELYVEPSHALEIIPRLPEWYDEPFADSSQIPTYLVCEMTRQHVTVVLAGDGGDELFGGYTRYLYGADIWKQMSRIPKWMRTGTAAALRAIRQDHWDTIGRLLPAKLQRPQMGHKLHKLAGVLAIDDPTSVYRQMITHWQDPDQIVLGAHEPHGVLWQQEARQLVPNFVDWMQYVDTLTYLPDDILVKVDRASMAVSLEARAPLLDHRVVEFAWKTPQHMKIRNGQGKWLMRQVLDRYVPRKLIERPKMGFGVPIDRWLRGPLKVWAESLLGEARLRDRGLFDPKPIRDRWADHLAGQNWAYPLWNVLMFEAWLERNHDVSIA